MRLAPIASIPSCESVNANMALNLARPRRRCTYRRRFLAARDRRREYRLSRTVRIAAGRSATFPLLALLIQFE